MRAPESGPLAHHTRSAAAATHTHTHASTHTQTHTHARGRHTYTHTRARGTHTHTHTCARPHTLACERARTHTHARARAHAHTHTHTHTHTKHARRNTIAVKNQYESRITCLILTVLNWQTFSLSFCVIMRQFFPRWFLSGVFVRRPLADSPCVHTPQIRR